MFRSTSLTRSWRTAITRTRKYGDTKKHAPQNTIAGMLPIRSRTDRSRRSRSRSLAEHAESGEAFQLRAEPGRADEEAARAVRKEEPSSGGWS